MDGHLAMGSDFVPVQAQVRGGGDSESIFWGRGVKELVSATASDVENKSGGKTNERPIILLVDLFLRLYLCSTGNR